jgi:hypothetical protein
MSDNLGNHDNRIVFAKFAAIISAAAILSTPSEKLRPYVNKYVIWAAAFGLFVAFVVDLTLFVVVAMAVGVLGVHVDVVEIKMKVSENFAEKQCKRKGTTPPADRELSMPLTMIKDDTSTCNAEAATGDDDDDDGEYSEYSYYSYYSEDIDDIDDIDDIEDIEDIEDDKDAMRKCGLLDKRERFVDRAPRSRKSHKTHSHAHSSLHSTPYDSGAIPNHIALKMVVEADKLAEQFKQMPAFERI